MSDHPMLGFILIAVALICLFFVMTGAASPIMQGQCVELNKTYDISGVGWYNEKIVYYGRYYDAYQNADNSSVEATFKIPYGISKLQNFWIDPSFFGDRLGYWYNYYDLVEKNSNARLFYVMDICPVQEIVEKPEPAIVNTSNYEYNKTLLPDKRTPYTTLLARGDSFELLNKTPMRYWIFHNEFPKYDIDNSDILLASTDFRSAVAGEYVIGVVYAGNNSIIEEYYNAHDSTIESVFKKYPTEYVIGLQSISKESTGTVQYKLDQMVKHSFDDRIEYYRVWFDDPIIQVEQYQQIDRPYNRSYLDIRGYTNVKAGTEITAELQSETSNGIMYYRTTAKSNVVEYSMSDWKQFSVLLPFNIADLPNGKHYVVLTVPQGARTVIEPYIKEELADHYQPPKTIRYVDNNPFIPTPTPEIVIKERIVERVNETVKVQEKIKEVDYVKLSDKVIETLIVPATLIIIAGVVLLYGLFTSIRAYRKIKEQKKP